jgi:hypothetical protein
MSAADLTPYLERPLTPPDEEALAGAGAGPREPRTALALSQLDRLLDPRPLQVETGWWLLPDGTAQVAARTPMPGVSAEMVDWWFDWHPREAIRYRIWHPRAHMANSAELPALRGAKAHWGAVHHPVEDVGVGVVHARIAFLAPSAIGFSGDALEDPRVATIVCGYVGDDRRRVRHTTMCHVFLREGDGVLLRSHFWLGSAMRPYAPAPLAALGERLLNRPSVRARAMPGRLPRALARHCAEEYANLGSLLGELYGRFGPES